MPFNGCKRNWENDIVKNHFKQGKWNTVSPKVTDIGYFAQKRVYKFEKDKNVLEFLKESSDYPVSEIRSMISMLGLEQNVITRKMQTLSGGEIVKILLCKMLLGRYNVLKLWTNLTTIQTYLDLEALESSMRQI